MKHFIVFDGDGSVGRVQTGVGAWNDDVYRTMVLTGSTCDEAGLREWANRSFGVPQDASLADIARGVARGGWVVVERVEPSPEFECPKCRGTDWQTVPALGLSSTPSPASLRCKACNSVRQAA